MLYTIARTSKAIVVIGSIPQYELNALTNVWAQEFKGQVMAAPDIAKQLGYTLVVGPEDGLNAWRKDLGLVENEVVEEVSNEERPEVT